MSAFDEDDYPLVEWAADRDVTPDPRCTLCWGEGACGATVCPCLVQACMRAFPAAADEAEPNPACRRCDGDGEDLHGQVCPCLMPGLRVCQEERETLAD